MLILNIGCGATRPPFPWVNVDTLRTQIDGEALVQLDKEPNYVEHDLSVLPWPWEENSVDGVLASHFCEHLTLMELQAAIREIYRILKPNGVFRASVPDAAYFRRVHALDDEANAPKLFGEIIADHNHSTFMSWALFFYGHKQIFTEDSLWCSMVNAGFGPANVMRSQYKAGMRGGHYCNELVASQDNRKKFSLFMEAYK